MGTSFTYEQAVAIIKGMFRPGEIADAVISAIEQHTAALPPPMVVEDGKYNAWIREHNFSREFVSQHDKLCSRLFDEEMAEAISTKTGGAA